MSLPLNKRKEISRLKFMEIERKFTLKNIPDLSVYKKKELEQGYLCTDPTIRVRKEDENYYMTYKGHGTLSREEYNLPLNESAYASLIKKTEGLIIKKTRYLIPYDKFTIELDVFSNPSNLIFAEVEFDSLEEANAFIPPAWFDKDVTDDPSYANSNISKRK